MFSIGLCEPINKIPNTVQYSNLCMTRVGYYCHLVNVIRSKVGYYCHLINVIRAKVGYYCHLVYVISLNLFQIDHIDRLTLHLLIIVIKWLKCFNLPQECGSRGHTSAGCRRRQRASRRNVRQRLPSRARLRRGENHHQPAAKIHSRISRHFSLKKIIFVLRRQLIFEFLSRRTSNILLSVV